eukprot:10720411-Ditylum_brightwellii.AAC.1
MENARAQGWLYIYSGKSIEPLKKKKGKGKGKGVKDKRKVDGKESHRQIMNENIEKCKKLQRED